MRTRNGGDGNSFDRDDGALARTALKFTAWAERWFPDAFIFVADAVVIVAAAAMHSARHSLIH